MTQGQKVIFITFTKGDDRTPNLFVGQPARPRTPFTFVDMSMKELYLTEWKQKVQTRVRRSDGVIALISISAPKAAGQLWEIRCAREERKPVFGAWIEKGCRIVPTDMGTAIRTGWNWSKIENFTDGLS